MAAMHPVPAAREGSTLDFNRPVTPSVPGGAGAPAEGAHKSSVTLEEFFKRFYGESARAPHGPKFKPDASEWHEHTLLVVEPDLKSKTKTKCKAKAKAMIRPQAIAEPSVPSTGPRASTAPQAAAVSMGSSGDAPKVLSAALLFPGQGSQYVKMLAGVKDIPSVQAMLSSAQEILGYDLLQLCLEGPEKKLEETRFCQPAMFVAGLAGLEKLRVERAEVASGFRATAGLSLGEYTALCAAGVFTFEDGLKLVRIRGEAMQEAAAQGKQAMLSVAGLDKDILAGLCQEASAAEGGAGAVCQIANELFPKGFACAGTAKAVEVLQGLAEKNGALQAKMLKTSGAFHTSLMGPAKETLGQALEETLPRMQPPKCTVFMNATAEALPAGTDPRAIVELLKRQLTSAVLWESTVRAMIDDGISDFYEVGPMKQLRAMMKRINPKVWNSMVGVEV